MDGREGREGEALSPPATLTPCHTQQTQAVLAPFRMQGLIAKTERMLGALSIGPASVRHKAEEQYVSLRSTLSKTLQTQGWKVRQVSFLAGSLIN